MDLEILLININRITFSGQKILYLKLWNIYSISWYLRTSKEKYYSDIINDIKYYKDI